MSSIRRTLLLSLIVTVVATTIALGRWQLRRLHDRRASNAVQRAAMALPPMRLPDELAQGAQFDSGRRVVAHGHFDAASQVILRGRVQNDAPAVQVVTPFVLDGSADVLWVLRGYVPSADAVTPPDSIPLPATGELSIDGIAYAIPVTPDSGRPFVHNGTTSWQRLDRGQLTRLRAGSLPVYLLLAGGPSGAGRLAAVAPPEINDGPHLSYAIQWFGIGLAVFLFGVIVLWRDGRGSARLREAP